MKKTVLVSMLILIGICGSASAKEDKLGVTLDLTYVSKWMSKGAQCYGQQGGLFKTIDIDFYGTGIGVKTTHRNATAGGYVDKERFDFRPYYKNVLFADEAYATNYNISVGYKYYPGLAASKANTTYEWIFAFSWPNILPEGFVPGYIAHYEYPAKSGYIGATGWVHRFLLGYDMETEVLPKPLRLSSEIAYTDGLGGASHDWSYATFGASTKFDITDNLSFVPGLYHQISMDDSVCKGDVTYCKLSMKYKF
ncbi:MAG: hypothetical protein KAQ89_02050 [Planctomycetes bacterium]|nr:hypothetical protein [Planctomycetota bacterium]